MRKLLTMVLGLWLLLGIALPAAAAVPASTARGVILDEAGRPIPWADVELYRLDGGLVAVLTADLNGRFQVEQQAAPGTLFQYRVSAKGYKTLDTGWMELPRSGYQPLRLTRLTGGLRVWAVDEAGVTAVARFLVTGADGQVIYESLDPEGRVELGALAPGQYRVAVRSGYLAPYTETVSVTAGATAVLTARLETAGAGVAGEVRDGRTGLPVRGASVHLLSDAFTDLLQGPVAADGRFRSAMTAGVTGPVRLLTWADGYRPVLSAPMTLAGGQMQDFSGTAAVVLAPATGVVRGVVLKSDGTPRTGAPVTLEAKGYGWMASLTTDEQGQFSFDAVPADPSVLYRVFVTAEREMAATGWMALADGVTDQLLLQTQVGYLQSGGTAEVGGQVVSAAGEPLGDARVDLYRRGELVRSVQTAGDGTFLLKAMPITRGPWTLFDPYTVRISKDGFVSTSQISVDGQEAVEFHLAGNSRALIRATLRVATTELRGRVVGDRGEAVADAQVYLMAGPTAPVGAMVRTDAQGWYTFKSVPVSPGVEYVLMGKAKGYQSFAGVLVAPAAVAQQSAPTVRLRAQAVLLTGQVRDPLGSPVSGATVELRRADGMVGATTVTDAAGAYSLPGPVGPGGAGLALVARRPGFVSGAVLLSEAASHDLTLVPAHGAISGQVWSATGAPVPGATVLLFREGVGGHLAAVRTAADGSYRFDGIAVAGTGRFWLRVQGSDLVPLLTLTPGAEQVVDLLVR